MAKSKWWVVLVVVVLLLLMWSIHQQDEAVNELGNESRVEHIDPPEIETNSNELVTDEALLVPPETPDVVEDATQSGLHDDPYVAGFIIASRLEACKRWRWYDEDTDQLRYESQKDAVKLVSDSCLGWQAKWPDFEAEAMKQRPIEAKSELGSVLKQWPDPSNTQPAELEMYATHVLLSGIKNRQSEVIRYANKPLLGGWRFFEDQNRSLLGGGSSEYLKEMFTTAMTKLSCDMGSDCGPDSVIMVKMCVAFRENCELNFQQWYERNLTPGMLQDSEVLMSYYVERANGSNDP